MSEHLIHDYAERITRAAQKEWAVLEFLRDEVYSSTAVLAVEMGIGERGARYVLNRMVKKGLLVRDEVKFMAGRSLPIWGITAAGVLHDLEPDEVATINLRHHSIGSVSPVTIEHTLDVQRCRQYCLGTLKCHSWTPTRLLPVKKEQRSSKKGWPVYPDGVALYPSKSSDYVPVAFEVERSRKTPQRYVQIIKGHLRNIEMSRYQRVVYYCPSQKEADSLKALFLRLMEERNITHVVDDHWYGAQHCIKLFVFSSMEKF